MAMYWMNACQCCNGTGRKPANFDSYRVSYELQDEGPNLLDDRFVTLDAARKFVEGNPDPSCVYQIIAPNGEIVK